MYLRVLPPYRCTRGKLYSFDGIQYLLYSWSWFMKNIHTKNIHIYINRTRIMHVYAGKCKRKMYRILWWFFSFLNKVTPFVNVRIVSKRARIWRINLNLILKLGLNKSLLCDIRFLQLTFFYSKSKQVYLKTVLYHCQKGI